MCEGEAEQGEWKNKLCRRHPFGKSYTLLGIMLFERCAEGTPMANVERWTLWFTFPQVELRLPE